MKTWSSLLQKMMISYRIIWLSPKSALDDQVSHLFHLIGLCLGALWLDIDDFNDVGLCENMAITPTGHVGKIHRVIGFVHGRLAHLARG
jgi:hypothetical protein